MDKKNKNTKKQYWETNAVTDEKRTLDDSYKKLKINGLLNPCLKVDCRGYGLRLGDTDKGINFVRKPANGTSGYPSNSEKSVACPDEWPVIIQIRLLPFGVSIQDRTWSYDTPLAKYQCRWTGKPTTIRRGWLNDMVDINKTPFGSLYTAIRYWDNDVWYIHTAIHDNPHERQQLDNGNWATLNFPKIGRWGSYDTVFTFGMNNAIGRYGNGYGEMLLEVKFLTAVKWRKNPPLNPPFIP